MKSPKTHLKRRKVVAWVSNVDHQDETLPVMVMEVTLASIKAHQEGTPKVAEVAVSQKKKTNQVLEQVLEVDGVDPTLSVSDWTDS